jgi:hypothetical protein
MADNLIKSESRRAQRFSQEGRVFFVRDGGCRTMELAYLEDLSMTGCRVISSSPLRVGMELGLSLVGSWNERDIVVELAKVRRGVGNRLGLDFLGVDPLERERLQQFLKTVEAALEDAVRAFAA